MSLEPMSLGDVWEDIRPVAVALDRPRHGENLVTTLVGRLDALRRHTDRRSRRPTIACLEWIDPLMSAGNWVPELVDIAGGTNLFGQAGRHSGYLAAEQLVTADADVIAIMPCGFDIARARRETSALTARPEWQRLSAVKGGRVFITDGNQYFKRPGPCVVESAEILAELLHPGVVGVRHRGTGWVGSADAMQVGP